jgi:voltage-dependent potassium channel beta subunit
MKYRRLGISGMKVSEVSIGSWLTYGSDNLAFEATQQCLNTAIDHGINFIDSADIYSKGKAEEAVGEVVKNHDRSKLVISTKAFRPMSDDPNDVGLSRKHLFESIDKSLKRLQTDYIDIFYCHRYDIDTTTEETVRALSDLVTMGKIRYWGTSMWEPWQIDEAAKIAKDVNGYLPVVEQPVYNMFQRDTVEGDYENTVSEHGIGLTVFSPLAQGILTGKYNDSIPEDSRAGKEIASAKKGLTEDRLEKARKLAEIASDLDVEMSALALAWALNHQNVDSVITGATKPEHITSNIKAIDIDWSPELESRIEEVLSNKPYNSSRHAIDPDEIAAL